MLHLITIVLLANVFILPFILHNIDCVCIDWLAKPSRTLLTQIANHFSGEKKKKRNREGV